MFTIDLLKARAIPPKSRLDAIIFASITIVIPVIVAIVMLGYYLNNAATASIQKQKIVNYDKKIGLLSNAIDLQRQYQKEENLINNCLIEVSTSLSRHMQWSLILESIVKNLPDSMTLNSLAIKQRSIKKKVPQKNDPKKMISISLPVPTLQLTVVANRHYDSDAQLRNFKDRLYRSEILQSRLDQITVSRQTDQHNPNNLVSYKINLVFKSPD